MEGNDQKRRNKARIAAIIYGAAVLLLFFLFGFREPVPPLAEEGVLLNFGFVESAAGDIVPQNNNEEQVEQVEQSVESTPVEQVEEVVTQDVEESYTVKETVNEVVEEVVEVKEKTEEVKEEEKDPEVNKDALFGKNKNSNNQSQGIDKGKGDQGDPLGSLDSDNYEGKSTGLGDAGIGFDLAGRSMISPPRIDDKSQKKGTIKIKIKVDRTGKVMSASYTQLGSTTSDSYLVKKSLEAAYKTQFNVNKNAPIEQNGTMTFVYKVK